MKIRIYNQTPEGRIIHERIFFRSDFITEKELMKEINTFRKEHNTDDCYYEITGAVGRKYQDETCFEER